MRKIKLVISVVFALLVLGTTDAHAWPVDRVSPKQVIPTKESELLYASAVAVDDAGRVYVASFRSNAVSAFELDASGQYRLVKTLMGSETQLRRPVAIAFDEKGRMYVANDYGISVYGADWPAGSTRPERVLSGPNTQIVDPTAVAFDSTGRLYVLSSYRSRGLPPKVVIFAQDWSTSDPRPIAELSGPLTMLKSPQALAFDDAGRMYVANTSTITVYPAGWRGGNEAPIAAVGLAGVRAMAFDDLGYGYAVIPADVGGATIRVLKVLPNFPDVVPYWIQVDALSGLKTGLKKPTGIAIDERGSLLTVDEGTHSLSAFHITTQTIDLSVDGAGYYRLAEQRVAISASATSGLQVALDVTTPQICSVAPDQKFLIFLDVGVCSITASQAGNNEFSPASPVIHRFSVARDVQSITLPTAKTVPLSKRRITLLGSSSSGLPIVWSSLTPTTCATRRAFGQRLTLKTQGVCTVVARQPGNGLYDPAPDQQLSFKIR